MMTIGWGIWSLIALWRRMSWLTWVAGGVGLWALGVMVFQWSPAKGVGLLTCFGLIAALLGPTPWRRAVVAKIRESMKRQLPSISETEKIALNAGTVGFEASLLAGRPDWDGLLRLKSRELTPQEQAFLDGPVNQVCRMTQEWLVTHEDTDLPREVWSFLREHRFFGMIIPTDHGGLGFSARAHAMVITRLAAASSTLAATVGVPNSLGPAELLLHYGTEHQRDFYLPRLARGAEIPCFALTGPEAGSDATSLPDFGTVVRERRGGKDVLGIRLTFRKRYITLAPVATLIGMAFRLHDPHGLLGGAKDRGLTLAIVPRDTKGLTIGRRHLPLNSAFQNGPMEANNLWVPLDAVIGGTQGIGQGWRMLMECLSVGRAITLPSTAAGIGRATALATGAYARVRQQFGLPLGRFEAVEEAVAKVTGLAIQAAVWSETAADLVDAQERPAVVSAMAKAYATGSSRDLLALAMDVHGGKGIMLGPRNYLGRWWQGAPIAITVEGANLMTRSLMIVGQGLLRCHPWLRREVEALGEAGDAGNRSFEQALVGHIQDVVSGTLRAGVFAWTGLTPAARAVAPAWRNATRTMARQAAALRLVSEAALLSQGGRLKFKGRLTARIADAWSNLYLACATIRWHEQQCREKAIMTVEESMAVYHGAHWAVIHALHQADVAMLEALEEIPQRWLARGVRWVLFPLGRGAAERTGAARDKAVTQAIMAPGQLREVLAERVFMEATESHPIGRIHHALPRIIELEPVVKEFLQQWNAWVEAPVVLDTLDKVDRAVAAGWCTLQRAALVREHALLVRDAIEVDDFEADEARRTTTAPAVGRLFKMSAAAQEP